MNRQYSMSKLNSSGLNTGAFTRSPETTQGRQRSRLWSASGWAIPVGMALVLLARPAAGQTSTSEESTAKSSLKQTSKPTGIGNFSVSLAVKDIKASAAFYRKLGFKKVGGNIRQNWLILQNGTTNIGLFQGMFKKNVLTFNPGWDSQQKTLEKFDDVRSLQKRFKANGLKFTTEANESGKGPASFTLVDPDGNPILFDQHVPKPE